MAQRPALPLGVDEAFDVGMIAAQRRHHGAVALMDRQQRGAGALPQLHERHRPGGDMAAVDRPRAGRPLRREIAAAAAGLQRHHRFAQRRKDTVQRVVQRAGDEAVEQRAAARAAGAGQDAAARQETEVGQQLHVAVAPRIAMMGIRLRQRQRDPLPAGGDVRLAGVAAGPVPGVPDMCRQGFRQRVVLHYHLDGRVRPWPLHDGMGLAAAPCERLGDHGEWSPRQTCQSC